MLHEYLRAFTLANYPRLPTPPPQRMVLDFENATCEAAHVVFQTVELKGCAFHFMQAKGYQGSNMATN